MIFRFFFEFSSCQLQAGRTNSRVAHSSLSLYKFDELIEIRNRIHAEQRQEPAIQLKGFGALAAFPREAICVYLRQ